MGKLLDGTLGNELTSIKNIINSKAGRTLVRHENETQIGNIIRGMFHDGSTDKYVWLIMEDYNSASVHNDHLEKYAPVMVGDWKEYYAESAVIEYDRSWHYRDYNITLIGNRNAISHLKYDYSNFSILLVNYEVLSGHRWSDRHIRIKFESQGSWWSEIGRGETMADMYVRDLKQERQVRVKFIKFRIPANSRPDRIIFESANSSTDSVIHIHSVGLK